MILVTAATGKVGRELVNLLIQKGEKIVAVTEIQPMRCCHLVL